MSTQTKFQPNDQLRHLKTGGLYRVIGLATIEATLEDVYVYESMSNQRLWIRPQKEMEDGRFVKTH
jgi:hypothetical protein